MGAIVGEDMECGRRMFEDNGILDDVDTFENHSKFQRLENLTYHVRIRNLCSVSRLGMHFYFS